VLVVEAEELLGLGVVQLEEFHHLLILALQLYSVTSEVEEPCEVYPLLVKQNSAAVLAVKVGVTTVVLLVAALYTAELAAVEVVADVVLAVVLLLNPGALEEQMLIQLVVVVLLELAVGLLEEVLDHKLAVVAAQEAVGLARQLALVKLVVQVERLEEEGAVVV